MSKNEAKKGLITAGIKARVANEIRKELYKKKFESFTQAERILFFEKVFNLNKAMHDELNNLKENRRQRAKVQKLREERGYRSKKHGPVTMAKTN